MNTMLLSKFKDDTLLEIGVDEAGRGSFWGPIVAGALIIPDESTWSELQRDLLQQLRDSKKLSSKKREIIADKIKELIPNNAFGMVSAHEINENGITWANIEVFRRAINNLSLSDSEMGNTRLIIDGNLQITDWNGEQELIVEGDSKYLAIAGASILAKVEHDRWIKAYCSSNPECNDKYDLIKSNGYGTVKHRDGIKIYGSHEMHRSLYVKNWLPGITQKVKSKKKCIKDENKCLINFKL